MQRTSRISLLKKDSTHNNLSLSPFPSLLVFDLLSDIVDSHALYPSLLSFFFGFLLLAGLPTILLYLSSILLPGRRSASFFSPPSLLSIYHSGNVKDDDDGKSAPLCSFFSFPFGYLFLSCVLCNLRRSAGRVCIK